MESLREFRKHFLPQFREGLEPSGRPPDSYCGTGAGKGGADPGKGGWPALEAGAGVGMGIGTAPGIGKLWDELPGMGNVPAGGGKDGVGEGMGGTPPGVGIGKGEGMGAAGAGARGAMLNVLISSRSSHGLSSNSRY